MKRLLILLIFIAINLNANAIDNYLKKQCQNIVYGSGKLHYEARGYLTGIIAGFDYIVPNNKKKKGSQGEHRFIACERALNSKEKYGFEHKYKQEAYNYMVN